MPAHDPSRRAAGNPYRIREPGAAALTEIWLISTVVTIFGIRLYLHITGYPQVGGDTLHIAHMIWGGLGMAVGFGMLILFAHQVWKPIAAIVAGAGFGTFIDELGKFITRDNDYFFEPAIALIYAVVVVLYIGARYLERKRKPTEADHLFLAARGIQWLAIGKLDDDRKRIALAHLDASDSDSPIVGEMRALLESAHPAERSEQSRMLTWRNGMIDRYWAVVESGRLALVIVVITVVKAVQIFGSLAIGFGTGSFEINGSWAVFEWGTLVAVVVAAGLALLGLARLRGGDRVSGLHAFVAATLVSLLFGQLFAFASNQFLSFANLVVELVIFSLLRFAIAAESAMADEDGDGRPDAEAGLGAFI